MIEKPWWLWEGAAVRFDDDGAEKVGFVTKFDHDGVEIDGWAWFCFSCLDDLIPIENPAVMLAPVWATEVHIVRALDEGLYLTWLGYEGERTLQSWINWPQCPDHLKGHTWKLPKRRGK